ncbi:type I-E CRISPR-associated protein Cse2/CasB [Streptomyces sp. 3MP-14]|uniref:Type I-E CRISPR-associated protein Cse2/CasB n=1 Tax=Streptomyces mimosae TaxID=2586635 RepID=A0A5N6AQR6_9ACTN|nr:type I-E CRISPR-associated protein Cse2/CasB [Streptomyces mimosae]KAB8178736.1 type I-E CRISPR-associated protein Cse2/CasB [Streptomyces sp. 3MP-14]
MEQLAELREKDLVGSSPEPEGSEATPLDPDPEAGAIAEGITAAEKAAALNPLLADLRLAGAPDRESAGRRLLSDEKEWAREEEAVHLAVTLWALHQQSIRDDAMHQASWTLGRAVRELGRSRGGPDASAEERLSDPVRKRFVRVGTATSFESLTVRLRDLVLLMRAERVPLDYGRLAHQLWRWQYPHQRAEVCRWWGREFHHAYRSEGRQRAEAAEVEPEVPLDISG